jgi:radical SAM modification target selenobiotic family peptide
MENDGLRKTLASLCIASLLVGAPMIAGSQTTGDSS